MRKKRFFENMSLLFNGCLQLMTIFFFGTTLFVDKNAFESSSSSFFFLNEMDETQNKGGRCLYEKFSRIGNDIT